jgi:hypothetical protein
LYIDTAIWDKIQVPKPMSPLLDILRKKTMWTSDEGALTLLFLGVATEKLEKENVTGKYYHPQSVEVENPFALDEKLQDDLWTFSEQLVAPFYSKE